MQVVRAAGKTPEQNTSKDCFVLEIHESGGRRTQTLGKESWGRFFVNSENSGSLPFLTETV